MQIQDGIEYASQIHDNNDFEIDHSILIHEVQ